MIDLIVHIVVEACGSKDIIGESSVGVSAKFVPRIGDELLVLMAGEEFWIGEEYSDTAIVESVYYDIFDDRGSINVLCKATSSSVLEKEGGPHLCLT